MYSMEHHLQNYFFRCEQNYIDIHKGKQNKGLQPYSIKEGIRDYRKTIRNVWQIKTK